MSHFLELEGEEANSPIEVVRREGWERIGRVFGSFCSLLLKRLRVWRGLRREGEQS